MDTLVIYYSYSGVTKALAQEIASKGTADIAQIMDAKRPGMAKALFAGCFAAIRGKPWPIQPLEVDLGGYSRIDLLSPVWANSTPPAVNAFVGMLPQGKAVSVKMVSDSGRSKCEDRLKAAIEAKGCEFAGLEDVRNPAKAAAGK